MCVLFLIPPDDIANLLLRAPSQTLEGTLYFLRFCMRFGILWICCTLLLNASCAIDHNKGTFERLKVGDLLENDVVSISAGEGRKIPDPYFDPDLKSILSEFINDARKYNKPHDPLLLSRLKVVKYVDQLSGGSDQDVLALCIRYKKKLTNLNNSKESRSWSVVEVDRTATAAYVEDNSYRLKKLLYHEFVHCLHGKGHKESKGATPHIMRAQLFKMDLTESTWTDMVKQLFTDIDSLPALPKA